MDYCLVTQPKSCYAMTAVMNLFTGVTPKETIPVTQGPPAHKSAQKGKKLMYIIAFVQLMEEPLDCTCGTLARPRVATLNNQFCLGVTAS